MQLRYDYHDLLIQALREEIVDAHMHHPTIQDRYLPPGRPGTPS